MNEPYIVQIYIFVNYCNMDVFIKGFVALFDLLKFFPRTFKLLKKNLINARNHPENMISG